MLPYITNSPELSAFRQYWFVTITPYGTDIEPDVPAAPQVIETFKKLFQSLDYLHQRAPELHAPALNSICWRYDPVFITGRYSVQFHIETFRHMARELAGYTEKCVISFIDIYGKTKHNFPEAKQVTAGEQAVLAGAFAEAGKQNGMSIQTCAEALDLGSYGVRRSACISRDLFRAITGSGDVKIPSEGKPRPECGCIPSRDIGEYNTCLHGCRYCYANYDRYTVMKNAARHADNSPLLTGWPGEHDEIRNAVQSSWLLPDREEKQRGGGQLYPDLWSIYADTGK